MTKEVRALSRGIAVLRAINHHRSLTLMEISEVSDVPYPTVARIVKTLMAEGLVGREPTRKAYHPTALVQTLSQGYVSHHRLASSARDHIVELTRRIAWPVAVATHVGSHMIVADCTDTLTSLTFTNLSPGDSLPLVDCASGLAYLSFVPDDERADLIRGLRRLKTPIVSPTALDRIESGELVEEIRANGYATRENAQQTRRSGRTSSMALPLFAGGRIFGALTVTFFSSAIRIPAAVQAFLDDMRETALQIEASLSGRPMQPLRQHETHGANPLITMDSSSFNGGYGSHTGSMSRQ